MRGAGGGVFPGVGQAVKVGGAAGALRDHQTLQRGQPVLVVAAAVVTGAGGAQLGAQGLGPLRPGEQAALVQLQRDGEGVRLPGRAEHGFAPACGQGQGGAAGGELVGQGVERGCAFGLLAGGGVVHAGSR